MSRTLIVFGAGASVDCLSRVSMATIAHVFNGPNNRSDADKASAEEQVIAEQAREVRRYMPPLTANLVLSLQGHSQNCAQLLEVIDSEQQRSVKYFDFESTLRKLYSERAEEFKTEFEALRIALRDRMSQANNIGKEHNTLYTSLFGRLRGSAFGTNRKFVVLNLNYDRLAEMAMSNRKGFQNLADYTDEGSSKITLLHPHGSCAWALKNLGSTTLVDNDYRSAVDEYVIRKGDLREGNLQQHIEHPRGNYTSDVPALALPMSGDEQGKTVWPVRHHDFLMSCLPDIDSLIVIGWRGADKHIVALVSERIGKLREVHLVGLNDANKIEENLQSWFTTDTEIVKCDRGFSGYLNHRLSPFENLLSLKRE